jgi:hypothetical protein
LDVSLVRKPRLLGLSFPKERGGEMGYPKEGLGDGKWDERHVGKKRF